MKKLLSLALCASCLACNTAQTTSLDPIQDPTIAHAPQTFVPYTLEINGQYDNHQANLTLSIHYQMLLDANPILTLEPLGDTELVNTLPIQTLPKPVRIGATTHRITLRGSNPSVRVTVSQSSQGFAIEMHEQWPHVEPKALPHDVIESPLPARIQVDGNTLSSGIEITP